MGIQSLHSEGALHTREDTTEKKLDTMRHLLIVLPLLLDLVPTEAHNCAGCTPLDTLAFDKIINAFPVSLVKFDVAYPYGDNHDEFAKVSKDAASVERLFIGEVGIKDYGEKDNEDLAARFGIKKDDYPVAVVFTKGEAGEMKHVKFTGKFKAEDLKTFVRKESGVYLPLIGCIEEFDKLADELLAAPAKARSEVVKRAEDAWDKAEGLKNQKRAEIYVKIMRKVADLGVEFIKTEDARVKKVMDGKVSKEKKEELEERLNILKSFSLPSVKVEL